MSKHQEYLQSVTDRLVKQIEENKAPWQRPFDAGDYSNTNIPINVHGKPYNGMNMINLMCIADEKGYTDNRWLTFNGAKEQGGKVKKGEKASDIYYWKFTKTVNKKDDDGKNILDENGRPVKIEVKLEKPQVFFAKVFNADQIDGLPPREVTTKKLEEWERHEAAERILKASNVPIIHKVGERAYYSPHDDHIVLPERTQFKTNDAYYATALHELGHATGHESRLNRDLSGSFGSESYAKEELRAEIASMLIGQELQIGHDPSQHIAYLQSWAKVVQNEPKEIFKAVKDADAIHQFVLSLDSERVKEKDEVREAPDNPNLNKLTEESNLVLNKMLDAHYAGKAPDSEQPYAYATTPYEVYAAVQKHIDSKFEIYARNDANGEYHLNLYEDGIDSDIAVKIDSKNGRTGIYIDSMQVGHNNDAIDLITKHLTLATAAIEQAKELNKPQEEITNTKLFINVPFAEKNEAKELGAKWDKENKSWYVPAGEDLSKFEKWSKEQIISLEPMKSDKTYLYTIPSEKDEVKALGARWDKENSLWYAPTKDIEKFTKWVERPSIPSPQEAFANHLREQRIVVPADHPKMDGKAHRLANENSDSKNVMYQLYPNHGGVPSGRITNFSKDGEPEKWVYPIEYIQRQQNIDAVDRAKYGIDYVAPARQKEAAQAASVEATKAEITLDRQQVYDKTANRVQKLFEIAPIAESHDYLNRKGVSAANVARIVPHSSMLPKELQNEIVIIDDWRKAKSLREQNPDKMVVQKDSLIIPQYNKDGELRSFETIGYNGAKYALKDGEKNELSLQLGKIENGKPFVVAEGYATGATMHEQAKIAAVVAFGKGGLESVAQEYRAKYPDSKIYFAADNDHLNELNGKDNAGIQDATKAADAINGHVLIPQFEIGDTGKDWNDVFIDKGIDEFRSQLKSQLEQINGVKQVEAIETVGKDLTAEIDKTTIDFGTLNHAQQKPIRNFIHVLEERFKDNPVELQQALKIIQDKIPDIASGKILISDISQNKEIDR